MEGHIFTTYGWLPVEQVEIRDRVTFEDHTIKWVSHDKFLKSTGEFVGNDLEGIPGPDFCITAGLDTAELT